MGAYETGRSIYGFFSVSRFLFLVEHAFGTLQKLSPIDVTYPKPASSISTLRFSELYASSIAGSVSYFFK